MKLNVALLSLMLFSISACSVEKIEYYDASEDLVLQELAAEFRKDPEYGTVCDNSKATIKCRNPIIDKRNEYLRQNCLIIHGSWIYSKDYSGISVDTKSKYIRNKKCNK